MKLVGLTDVIVVTMAEDKERAEQARRDHIQAQKKVVNTPVATLGAPTPKRTPRRLGM